MIMTMDIETPPLLLRAVSDIMASSRRCLHTYEPGALRALLAYAHRENVPELGAICSAELRLRREPETAPGNGGHGGGCPNGG
jgi:hypothetical protein